MTRFLAMLRDLTRSHAPLRAVCPLRVYNTSTSGLRVRAAAARPPGHGKKPDMAAATFFAMAATTYELLERVFSKACSPICPSSDELFAQSRAPLKDLPGFFAAKRDARPSAALPHCEQSVSRGWALPRDRGCGSDVVPMHVHTLRCEDFTMLSGVKI